MKTKNSIEVAEAIKLHIISRFGVPYELRFDRGREFSGEVKILCETLNIKYKTISTKHPQGNGQVERYVGTVKKIIIKMLSEEGKYREQWIDCLPACLMSLRFL